MKHPFKDWLIAVRPWSFPASAMPVIASVAYAYAHYQTPNWLNGIWALLNIIIFMPQATPGAIISITNAKWMPKTPSGSRR